MTLCFWSSKVTTLAINETEKFRTPFGFELVFCVERQMPVSWIRAIKSYRAMSKVKSKVVSRQKK